MQPIDTTAAIETPEQVEFRYRLAGPTRRALAYLVDALVRGLIGVVLAVALTLIGLGSGTLSEGLAGASTGMLLVVFFLLEWGYYVFCEQVMSGQSPGKRWLKLRVVRDNGTAVRLSDSVLRNLLRAADLLPSFYAVGLLTSSLDHRMRRLGDLAAGTFVIVDDHTRLPLPHRPPTPGDSGVSIFPARIELSVDEHRALERFVRRLPTLNPNRAEDLARIIAPELADRMGLPRPGNPVDFLLALHHARSGGAPDKPAGRS